MTNVHSAQLLFRIGGGFIVIMLALYVLLLRRKVPSSPAVEPASASKPEPPQVSPGGRPPLKIRLFLRGQPIKTYSFSDDVVTVGRDPKSDIVLDNVNISREHLRFEFTPGGYYTLVDLGSPVGTFLNDEQVSRGYVYNHDTVRIGKYTLWIGYETSRVA